MFLSKYRNHLYYTRNFKNVNYIPILLQEKNSPCRMFFLHPFFSNTFFVIAVRM